MLYYDDCIRQEIFLNKIEKYINITVPQTDNGMLRFDDPEIVITYTYGYPVNENRHAYYFDRINVKGKEKLTKLPYRAQHKYCPACSNNNIKIGYTKSFGENFDQEKLICRCETCGYNWHTNLDDK